MERRKELRRRETTEESLLWDKLRKRKFDGYKFYRQYGIENYIVDFYCPKLRLVIEIDGSQHDTKEALEYDKIRAELLNSFRIKVLRFKNREVMDNTEQILKEIRLKIKVDNLD